MQAENRISVSLVKRRLSAAMPWISLFVVLLVFWWLKLTGITLAGEAFCGIPDGRLNTSMPSAEIGGVDFIGVIEIPAYSVSLPIRADWKPLRVFQYPCRLSGSTYGGDLIIGGSDAEGQFDFMKFITGGDRIFVTDPAGVCFSYRVTEIVHTSDASVEALITDADDLVIFVKNTYSFGYTGVRCKSE